jgi:hypothetical protein
MKRFLSWTQATALMSILFAGGLRAAAPGSAAPSGFAVVVHRSNATGNLSVGDLRALFEGATTHWPDHSKVVLVERDAAGSATAFLTERLLKVSLTDYKRNLAGLEFKGAEPVTLRVLNSDPSACKFVFNVPSAIALIDAASLSSPDCSRVKVLKIDGRLPGEEGYRLK